VAIKIAQAMFVCRLNIPEKYRDNPANRVQINIAKNPK
tara:strand:- start:464 stop:577 length:114 start_codon:yes stop_codon:yes gene_type:complete